MLRTVGKWSWFTGKFEIFDDGSPIGSMKMDGRPGHFSLQGRTFQIDYPSLLRQTYGQGQGVRTILWSDEKVIASARGDWFWGKFYFDLGQTEFVLEREGQILRD